MNSYDDYTTTGIEVEDSSVSANPVESTIGTGYVPRFSSVRRGTTNNLGQMPNNTVPDRRRIEQFAESEGNFSHLSPNNAPPTVESEHPGQEEESSRRGGAYPAKEAEYSKREEKQNGGRIFHSKEEIFSKYQWKGEPITLSELRKHQKRRYWTCLLVILVVCVFIGIIVGLVFLVFE